MVTETKADDNDKQSEDAPAPEDSPPTPSWDSAQPSKGKQRALACMPATMSKGKGKKAQKEPRETTERKLTFLVDYLSSAKDPKGKPWGKNEGVKGICCIAGSVRVCASELIAAAHVISQLV